MRFITNWLLRKEKARIDAYIEEERRILYEGFNSRMDYLDRKYYMVEQENKRIHSVLLQSATLNINPCPIEQELTK